jgi:uncharacterized protein with PIN domain
MAEAPALGEGSLASDAPGLLCDEMLRGIGRWLRIAGYDTAIASEGMTDRDLLALAGAEGRLVLTCDRKLARLVPAGVRVITLATESLDGAACELSERLGIDWLRAPFCRCLVDNAGLQPARPVDLARIPEPARHGAGPITVCPACRRVYWPGSHVRRMRARLERWAATDHAAGVR